MITKECNNCKHQWTPVLNACPRCSSIDINYLGETQLMLPMGIDTKEVGPDLTSWLKKATTVIKSMPQEKKPWES